MNAEDLIQQRREKRDDLQLEFDGVRGRTVVVGLGMKNVEIEGREIARDRRGIALAPAGMVEDRRVDTVQAQPEPERERRTERDRPAPLSYGSLNVQYLLTKKLTRIPESVAISQVLWPGPR